MLLLAHGRSLHSDAYLEVVIPATRANNAHDLDELMLIGALDRQARALGRRDNIVYVRERLGKPASEHRNIRRRIKEAREVFAHAYLGVGDKWYLPDGTEAHWG